MANTGSSSTSIGRKLIMAASGLFLVIFLLQHFLINFTSVIDEKTFNEISHFMGTNVLIQFVMQPILIAGVIIHFVMGFILEMKNTKARNVKYAMNKPSANSSWMSRNMIYTGAVILGFLGLHFYDFWVPEIDLKYVQGLEGSPTRYFHELQHRFEDPVRVAIYCVSFVLLALHLMHGFGAAFQSVGVTNKRYLTGLQKFGKIFAIVVPLGFIFIALFHHLNQ